MTKITRAEIMETKLRERAGFMREAGHNDDADLDEEAANLIQSLRVSAALEPQQEEAVATKCDGQTCYYHGCQRLDGCAQGHGPTPVQKVQESQTVSEEMVEAAAKIICRGSMNDYAWRYHTEEQKEAYVDRAWRGYEITARRVLLLIAVLEQTP